METVLFQTSLIAAFFAGIVALFAPCCISFLLPAYLGSVFKEKEKVLLMTLIYGLGIFVTLFPAVIGISLISKYLFRFHDSVYYLGGIMLILVSIITFLGIKMPMPGITRKQKEGKVDTLSVFILGIFSGITSACCAPVLVGILTFAFLSPTFFGATLIGIAYVLGMITPLLLISLFLN
ncbi:MAG: cytochrome C biogenesis protein, partial [Candidatus Levybacteria bacterium CG_4_10_14_0_2_um_filter_35_8]